MRRPPRRLLALPWLVAVWVALWGEATAPNVVGGVVAGTVVLALFSIPRPEGPRSTVRPLAVVRFGLYFAWKLIEASAIVAWEVVTPWDRVTEGIIAVPLRGTSDTLATIVSNCVTLTPGTLTIEFARDPATLYVHVLHLHDVEQVRRDVVRLESLALAAFGSETARAALDSGAVTNPEED